MRKTEKRGAKNEKLKKFGGGGRKQENKCIIKNVKI